MEIYIGVDWARHGAVAVLSWQGREVRHTFERTIAGVRSLVGAARKLSRAPETPMRAAIEDGDRSLAALLVAHGMTVHVAEPTKAKNFAASLSSSRAKDDRRDARNLAKFAMSPLHRNEPYQVPSDQSEALGCLVAAHESAVNKSQRLVNQLRAKLVEVFPAIEVALGDLTTRTSLDLLMLAPTWAHGAAVSDREWETFARQHRIHEVRRAALRTALQEPWRTFGPTLASAHAIVVRALVGELRASVESIASIDRELEAVSARDPNAMRLRTVSGVGLIIASGLIDLGLGQSRARDDVAIACGAAPVTVESGESRVVQKRRPDSNAAANVAFSLGSQAAFRLTWAKAMYADGRARGQTHGTAVRRVGRSLLRILDAMLRTRTDYDEARYIAALRAKAVPWAHAIQMPQPEG